MRYEFHENMFKQTTLKNGIRVVTMPMRGTKTATVLVMVGTGSKYETRKQSGLSHFLEHMFFKGTKKRPDTKIISSELDSIGAEFNAFTSKEATWYYVKSDSSKIDLAMDVVSDMLLNSKFDAREIKREKGVINEEISMKYDYPMSYAEDLFEQLLYGNTPAGWDIIGTRKSVNSFKRPDFLKYFNSQYNAKNTYVVLTGNLGNTKEAEKKIAKYFSSPQFSRRGKNFQEKPAVKEKQNQPQILLSHKKTDQVHLCLGVRTYGFAHPNRTAIKLLAIILGGSMSSRMFIELRERRGLAYYVRTQAEHYTDSGYVFTRAGVPVNRVEEAIKVILSEYRKVKRNLVPVSELKRNKDLLHGRVALQLEASDNQADWYARQAVMAGTLNRNDPKYQYKITSPEGYLKKINKVTVAKIRTIARSIFVNSGLNLAMIGPFKDKKRFEKLLKI